MHLAESCRARADRSSALGAFLAGRFLSLRRRPQGAAAAPLLEHRGSFASAEAELFLAGSGEAAAHRAVFSVDAPAAEYAQTSYWAHVGGARSFLLLPLSELVDEHYTVYFCLGDRLAAGRQMPRFCT